MIGKRERDKPASSQPTVNPAKDEAISQIPAWSARRKDYRLVPISTSKSSEPRYGVKDRSPRVFLDELKPARILYWIELITRQSLNRVGVMRCL